MIRTKCSYPRCFNQRPCPTHRSQDNRRNAYQRGYTKRWQAYRLHFLRNNPLCVECDKAGRVTAATDVDHIKPINGEHDPLFYDPSNHQALCHRCHSRKTGSEGKRTTPTAIQRPLPKQFAIG